MSVHIAVGLLSSSVRADQHRTRAGPKDLGRNATEPSPADRAEAVTAYCHEGLVLIPSPGDFKDDGGGVSLDHLDPRAGPQGFLKISRPLLQGPFLPGQHFIELAAVLSAPTSDRLWWVLVGPHQHARGPEEFADTHREHAHPLSVAGAVVANDDPLRQGPKPELKRRVCNLWPR